MADNVVSVPANPGKTPLEVAQFWTPDKMEAAQPAPMPVVIMDGNGNVVQEGWSGKDGQIYETQADAFESYADDGTGTNTGQPSGYADDPTGTTGQPDETGDEQTGRWITEEEVKLAVRDRDPAAIEKAGQNMGQVGEEVQSGTTQTGNQWEVAATGISTGGKPIWQTAEQPELQTQMGRIHPQAALFQQDLATAGKAVSTFGKDVDMILQAREKLLAAVRAFQAELAAANLSDPTVLAAMEAKNKALRQQKKNLWEQLDAAKRAAVSAIQKVSGGKNRPKASSPQIQPVDQPGQVEPQEPAGDGVVVSVELNQDPLAVAQFWTPDRMEQAQPLPMPTV